MSFTTKKGYLKEAYWLAKKIFAIAFMDQTYTIETNNPWILTTAIKGKSEKGSNYEFVVQIRIVELNGLGKYCFVFNRLTGDALSFRKIWLQIENHVLAM